MTAAQKIKATILKRYEMGEGGPLNKEITEKNVDGIFDTLDLGYDIPEYKNDLRRSLQEETGIECDYSRYYDSKSVAGQVFDGSWVGWTYWFGGGKHGEPDAIDWIEDAYSLEVEEKEVTIIKRTFKKS